MKFGFEGFHPPPPPMLGGDSKNAQVLIPKLLSFLNA